MAFNFPSNLRYASTDEWLLVEGDEGTVGITDYAQDALGDVVYVDLPEVGATFEAGRPFGAIESVKAASDLNMPVAGEVIAVNQQVIDSPEMINADPYGDAWLIKIRITGAAAGLLDAQAYEQEVEHKKH